MATLLSPAPESQTTPYEVRVQTDVPVPMRDGTILRADVIWPVPHAGSDERFPVLLNRTAYQKRLHTHLAEAGFIVVCQDVRGRYASDGEYEPVHQMCGGAADREDGYDTVMWCAALDGANGEVGAFGSSYGAWLAWDLAITRPAPLKALYVIGMSVTSTQVEGIRRPGRRVQWFYTSGAPDARRRAGLPGVYGKAEAQYQWQFERHKWLWFLPWSEFPDYVFAPLTRYFKDYFRHPERDHFRFAGQHGEIDVPVLQRTGWYDRFVSGIDHFTAMQRHGRTEHARRNQRIVVGPWGHGFFKQEVGDVDFGPDSLVDDRQLMLSWFDHWLKGRNAGLLDGPPMHYFLMGKNEWRGADAWPEQTGAGVAGTRVEQWFLHSAGRANTARGDGVLSRRPPDEAAAANDTFDYDPRDPVPTIWPINDQDLPLDHRPLDPRHDLLVYVTERFEAALDVVGNPCVELHAASSARDTDFVARLCDVHPNGFVQPLTYGIVRARYRDGLERPRPLDPGAIERYTIELHPTAFSVLPGHRLRLELTSSDFPNYDRNHNTGDDDFSDPTLVTAHQTVFHTPAHASHVRLPVLG